MKATTPGVHRFPGASAAVAPPKTPSGTCASQGFKEERQAESHLTLWHPDRRIAVTIPVHTGVDLGRGLALRILKDAGFSVEDFVRLL